ncbi:hypothetical protein LCGC14_1751380 [marine sediment metagenome]|uniref:Uncharacterized protein n=1 Tax=marine sediment metagenome TaxID=412755 RepID=A0A0F9HR31_9ZZZZ
MGEKERYDAKVAADKARHGAKVTADKAHRQAGVKAVEKVEEAQVPEVVPEERTLYQGFVEEVVTRKFQEKRGDPVGRSARVWITEPKPGSQAVKSIYALGDPDVVQEIGEALESEYDYHGVSPQPISKEREGEVVGEELAKLYQGVTKEAPHVLPTLGEALKRMKLAGEPLGKLLGSGEKAADAALPAGGE